MDSEEYPLAGCACLACLNARVDGLQEWIEPEPEEIREDGLVLRSSIIEPFDIYAERSKGTMARLREVRRITRELNADKMRAKKEEKVNNVLLGVILILIVIYFGSGILYWNK